MLLAFNNHGHAYYAISDTNTTSETFSLFMLYLAETLDSEEPGWRKTSIILLDNASYHKSAYTLALLEKLELPTMYSGPYSFDIAPCELFFSRLKEGLLNPNALELGKR